MTSWTVRVESLSKKFGMTVRDNLKYGLVDSGRRMVGLSKRSEILRPGEFWALYDVNFELCQGDSLGIMGVNGSGKTTLLRILNGAFSPDMGEAAFRGKIGALIAAGAGFSPMLTGRENIFVNGTLLGMSPREIKRQFEEIVHFSGLAPFIDMPVRNYSSGMAVRLGFAVAVLGDPDILLVDEVLAVGDLGFQKRCYERILQIIANGATVVFVSHSVGAIWAVCNKGLFLNNGFSRGIQSVEDTCRAYDLENYRKLREHHQSGLEPAVDPTPEDARPVVVENFEICDARTGEIKSEFGFGEPILLHMRIIARERIPDVLFRFSIDAVHYKAIAVTDSAYSDGLGITSVDPGRYIVSTEVRNPCLRPGTYTVNYAVCRKAVGVHLFLKANAGIFTIVPERSRFFYDGDSPAVVHLDCFYSIEREAGL